MCQHCVTHTKDARHGPDPSASVKNAPTENRTQDGAKWCDAHHKLQEDYIITTYAIAFEGTKGTLISYLVLISLLNQSYTSLSDTSSSNTIPITLL